MKIFTILRNNWKKSLFFSGSITYGTYYLLDRKYNANLLQAYCYEALKYGRERVNPESRIKRVTVFLNPIANKERGRFLYDKNVAPLLYLSGLDVTLIRLEKNSEASAYMKEIDPNDTDCIVVAGGNATLNEVISGLAHRPDAKEFFKKIPIGIIPIGQTNTFAHKWLNKVAVNESTNESELRLLADSAMAIIKGKTVEADLMKVNLIQTHHVDYPINDLNHTDAKNRGAYSLLKENEIYALSNVSCGFVTETDVNLDNYWYFGWLKNYMNRYFMKRFLSRDPLKFELKYKHKCYGCSKCLNPTELQQDLDDLINDRDKSDNHKNQSLFSGLYRAVTKRVGKAVQSKEMLNEQRIKKEEQIKRLRELVERSHQNNDDCEKEYTNNLTQVQIISTINRPWDDETEDDSLMSSIDTVIVKDPEFNEKDMFLAQRKFLKEYEIRKVNRHDSAGSSKNDDQKKQKTNIFSLDIDGEIYKLSNLSENDLIIRVEHSEHILNLLKHDPHFDDIRANFWPNVYLANKKTMLDYYNETHDRNYYIPQSNERYPNIQMPPILPFEKYYLKFWN